MTDEPYLPKISVSSLRFPFRRQDVGADFVQDARRRRTVKLMDLGGALAWRSPLSFSFLISAAW